MPSTSRLLDKEDMHSFPTNFQPSNMFPLRTLRTNNVPAFTAHAPLHSLGSLQRRALCSRLNRIPRKRPRRGSPTLHAVFIWSTDGIFGEDDARNSGANDPDVDADGEELAGDPSKSDADAAADDATHPDVEDAEDHPIYGKSWPGAEASADADADGSPEGEDDLDADETIEGSGKRLYQALRRYSKGPEDVDGIRARTSDEAADAFRRVVMGIFGTIPGDSFDIVVNTERHGMSRLMQSSLATGYALRNAEYRMVLSNALHGPSSVAARGGSPASPAPPARAGGRGDDDEPDYMRVVPRRARVDVSRLAGSVEWWDEARDERAEMEVGDYVARLEAENELLRERLAASKMHEANGNRLLDYMRTLSPEKIAGLQAHISPEAMDAFKMTVRHVLGDVNPSKVQVSYSTSRDYMGQLAFWCLLVGYHVRNLEKKFEMTRMLDIAEPAAAHAQESEA